MLKEKNVRVSAFKMMKVDRRNIVCVQNIYMNCNVIFLVPSNALIIDECSFEKKICSSNSIPCLKISKMDIFSFFLSFSFHVIKRMCTGVSVNCKTIRHIVRHYKTLFCTEKILTKKCLTVYCYGCLFFKLVYTKNYCYGCLSL